MRAKIIIFLFPCKWGEKSSLGRQNYFFSLCFECIFYFCSFVWQPKCPCELNTRLDTFSKLSYTIDCEALKYLLPSSLQNKTNITLFSFRVSHFTFVSFFSIKKKNFSKGFPFLEPHPTESPEKSSLSVCPSVYLSLRQFGIFLQEWPFSFFYFLHDGR